MLQKRKKRSGRPSKNDELMVDEKALYIHRANYQIIDKKLL